MRRGITLSILPGTVEWSTIPSPCERKPARPETNLTQQNSWSPLLFGASESGLVGENEGERAAGRKKLVMLWEQNQ